MMTQVKTQTLMLAAMVVLTVTTAKDQFRGRLQGPEGERGSSALEWAIIAAIVVGVVAVVGVKITTAVNTHSANIK